MSCWIDIIIRKHKNLNYKTPKLTKSEVNKMHKAQNIPKWK